MDNFERYAIIGDVHGDLINLKKLFQHPKLKDFNGKFIFVGDLVNRGPYSKEVLDFVINLRKLKDVTVLLGNHEYYFWAYLSGFLSFPNFAKVGGVETIKSYTSNIYSDIKKELLSSIPISHLDIIEKAETHFETPNILISHTGLNPSDLKSRSFEDMVLKGHREIFNKNFTFDKLLVCGHYLQVDFVPYRNKNIICLDTGSGIGGPLYSYLWPDNIFISSH